MVAVDNGYVGLKFVLTGQPHSPTPFAVTLTQIIRGLQQRSSLSFPVRSTEYTATTGIHCHGLAFHLQYCL